MATCQLLVLLDESQPHQAGQPISGTVVVRCEKETNCTGLVVRSVWSTHGRGNVDTGEVDQANLFEGAWQAGQEYRYPFRLATASWPPTYYGTFLNVSHTIAAQAKIPWASDPKAQVEFPLVATTTPPDLKPTVAEVQSRNSNWLWWLLGPVILVAVLAAFATIMLIFLPLIAIIGGAIWFFLEVLPRWVTGPVACELNQLQVSAGDTLRGSMNFIPRRTSSIDGVVWTVQCVEECSSGSGSSRQTHRHELLKEIIRASEARVLNTGVAQDFEFQFELPKQVAPSLKFSDNAIKWTVEARIEIPRWPDWTKRFDLVVSPQASLAATSLESVSTDEAKLSGLVPLDQPKAAADIEWFQQVSGQLQQVAHQSEQLAQVVAAVRNFEFPLQGRIENRIEAPDLETTEDQSQLRQAQWWTAYCSQLNQGLVLAWQHTPSAIVPQAQWSGWAAIVGYDVDAQRILMVVTR